MFNKDKPSVLLGIAIILLVFSSVAFAQDISEDPRYQNKYGADSASCVQNLSIYGEYYKLYKRTKDTTYIDATIESWRNVFNNCPKSSQNLYIDGVKIVKRMIDIAETEEQKQGLIDTLFLVYDQRITAFGREGFVLGRKLSDMIAFRPDSVVDIYKTAKRSVELQGFESSTTVLYFYMAAAIDFVNEGHGEKSIIANTYAEVSPIVQHPIQNQSKHQKRYIDVAKRIDEMFAPYSSCEDLVEIFGDQYKAKPNDTQLLSNITRFLSERGCTDSDLYLNALTKLDSIQPGAQSKYLIGKLNLKKENYQMAASYLIQSAKLFSEDQDKSNAYLLASDACSKLNQYSKAREFALKSLEYDASNGHAYIIIGNLYANSASSTRYKEINTSYWAAVDQFQKAKRIDNNPDIQEMSSKLIAQYSRYFPSKRDIFLHALNLGSTFTVGGWINESTTIRSSD